MTRDEFEKYLNVVHEKSRIKEIIKNKEIDIDWETDKSKIDLSVLRSYSDCENVPVAQSIEYIETEKISQSIPLFCENLSDSAQIMELVELIKTGRKIIPPVFNIYVKIIDGVVKSESELMFRDGMHRIRIASALELKEIPIIVNKTYSHFYHFSNNSIEVTDDEIIIKSESYTHRYSFENHNMNIEIKDYGVSISDITS